MGSVFPTILTLLLPTASAVGPTLLARRRIGPVWAVMVGSLTLPVLMAGLAALALSQPNPEHKDAAGMLVAAVVMLAPVTILIGLAASLLTLLVKSKLRVTDSRRSVDSTR